jgi:hypothetical protein
MVKYLSFFNNSSLKDLGFFVEDFFLKIIFFLHGEIFEFFLIILLLP